MAQVIGTVSKLIGKVFARAEDGSMRELRIGDDLFEGEVLVTGAGAVVEVAVPGAPSVVLPGEKELLLNSELVAELRDSSDEAAVEDETLDALVAALEGEGDLLEALEATAAGGAGDEGSSFIRLTRIGFDLPELADINAALALEGAAAETGDGDNDLQLLIQDEEEPEVEPEAPPVVTPPVNEAPDAVDDNLTTDFDTAIGGNLLDNDSDPDGDAITVVDNTDPQNGTVVVNPDGEFVYTPGDDFSGQDSFAYTIEDSEGNTDTAFVTITVGAEPPPPPPPVTEEPEPQPQPEPQPEPEPEPQLEPNAPPVAEDDDYSVEFGGSVTADVTDNDSDSDGTIVAAAVITPPTAGTVLFNADGSFQYTPDAEFSGTDTFTYAITDDDGATSEPATVTITVGEPTTPPPTPEPVAPFAQDDVASTAEESPVTINVVTNDDDSDGFIIASSVTLVATPANGTVVDNGDGTFTYTPNDDFVGTDTFTYQVQDNDGLISNVATVAINVTNVREVAQFTDNFVNGVEYYVYASEADALAGGDNFILDGLTGDQGTPGSFAYNESEWLVFKIGDVHLATFSPEQAIRTEGLLFIHDLVGVNFDNSNDMDLENMAIFLQALDSDLTDSNEIEGLQTNDLDNPAGVNGNTLITISPETRAAFEGYVDPQTGAPLDLQTAAKDQISLALESLGIEYTRMSEASEDGNNIFETIAISHAQDIVTQLEGTSTFETREVDEIDTGNGIIYYESDEILAGNLVIGFSAANLVATTDPNQVTKEGLEITGEDGQPGGFQNVDVVALNNAGTGNVQVGVANYDDTSADRTGTITLDPKAIGDGPGQVSLANLAANGFSFAYTIWDWTANETVGVDSVDLSKAKIIANPPTVPEDEPYNQFTMTHTLVGDLLDPETGETFQSDIYTTDQAMTVRFAPEGFGAFISKAIAEYADDFTVPVEYSTDGGATWQELLQVGTYFQDGSTLPLPLFGFTWPANTDEVEFRIPLFDDLLDEPGAPWAGPEYQALLGQGVETILMTVESVGDTFFDEALEPGIIDNDPSGNNLPIVDINFVSLYENEGPAVFTVTLSEAASQDVTIFFETDGLGAVAGSDYGVDGVPAEVAGSVTIKAGETSAELIIPIIDDTIVESPDPEFALINLTGVSGPAVIGDPQATLRIFDNDFGLFAVSDAEVVEGETATVTVERFGSPGVEQTVTLTATFVDPAAGGDAVAGDLAPQQQLTFVLTFGPQDTIQTVDLSTVFDGLPEGVETFSVVLSNPTNGSQIWAAQGTGTVSIIDPPIAFDDPGSDDGGAIDLGDFVGPNGWSELPEGVTITGFDAFGNDVGVSGLGSSNNKIGVTGADQAGRAVPPQIGYDATLGTSEALVVEFGEVVDSASFTFSNAYANEGGGEQGTWIALLDGTVVGSGDFSAASGNTGQVDISGIVFDTLRFEAKPYDAPNDTATDSSDYFITGVTASASQSLADSYVVIEGQSISVGETDGVLVNDNDGDPTQDLGVNVVAVIDQFGNSIAIADSGETEVDLARGTLFMKADGTFRYEADLDVDLLPGQTAIEQFIYQMESGLELSVGDATGELANSDPNTYSTDSDSFATATISILGIGDDFVPPQIVGADIVVTGGDQVAEADVFGGDKYLNYTVKLGNEVTGEVGVTTFLTLTAPVAIAGSDFINTIEVSTDGGATWSAYVPSQGVVLPPNGDEIAVRVEVLADAVSPEDAELVILSATSKDFRVTDDESEQSSSTPATADGTIVDTAFPVAEDDPGASEAYSVSIGVGAWDAADSNGESVGRAAFDDFNNPADITSTNSGLGVAGTPRDETVTGNPGFVKELEYDDLDGGSEALEFSFSGYLNTATVGFGAFVGNEAGGEAGKWIALVDGTIVAEGTFVAPNDLVIDTGTAVFNELRFEALPTQTANGPGNDSSDFFVKSITGSGPASANGEYVTTESQVLNVADGANDIFANDTATGGPAAIEVNGTTYTPGATVALPSGAELVLNADGSFSYNPNGAYDALNAGDVATDSFTYQIEDADGNTLDLPGDEGPSTDGDSEATVTITIIGEGEPFVHTPPLPHITVDDVTVNEADGTLTFTVTRTGFLGNEGTVDFAINPGSATTPADYTGVLSGTVVFPAGTGVGSDTQTVTIDIVNDGVVELAESFNINLSNPSGVAILDAQGMGTITDNDNAPVAEDDSGTTAKGVEKTIDLAGNDTDADGDLDPASIVITGGPANGGLVVNPDGTVTYTPNDGYAGEDSFTYTIKDDAGNVSNTATVTLTVSNNPPTIDAEFGPVTITVDNVLDNDGFTVQAFDINDQPTNVSINLSPVGFGVEGGSSGASSEIGESGEDSESLVVTFGAPVFGAQVSFSWMNPTEGAAYEFFDADGVSLGTGETSGGSDGVDPSVTLAPPGGEAFTTIVFTALQSDGEGGDDYLINQIDTNFVYEAGLADGSGEGPTTTQVLGSFQVNDPDGLDDIVSVSIAGGESKTFTVSELQSGTSTVAGTFGTLTVTDYNASTGVGNYIYALTSNVDDDIETPKDSFTFTTTDDSGAVSTPDTITVNIGDDAPIAEDDTASLDEDSAATKIDVLANDTQGADGATVVAVGAATSGTVELIDGEVFYTPNAEFAGADSFTYTIEDADGEQSTATVNVTVNPVNVPPVAVDDDYSTGEDTPLSVTDAVNLGVLANDEDLDGDTLTVNTTPVVDVQNGTLVLNADGTFTYTPNADFNGEDSFTYEVSDGNGEKAQATVTITVNPANDPPVAVNDEYSTTEDTVLSVDGNVLDSILANDSDVDGDTLTVTTTPVVDVQNGTLVLNADGTFTYTPNADFSGEDTFTYEVSDGKGETAQATVTIAVNPENDPPVAVDDSATTEEDGPGIDIDVLANDTDTENDTLTVESFTQPTNGTVTENSDGTLKYVPKANFNGTDTFEYTVSDGDGTDTAVVTVTVTADPDPSGGNSTSITYDINAVDTAVDEETGDLGFANVESVSFAYDGGLGAATQSSVGGVTTFAADDGTWTLMVNEATGEYTFTQHEPHAHDAGSDLDEGKVTITLNGNNETAQSVLTLQIGDDGVTAVADMDTSQEGGEIGSGKTNVALIIDVSGSMAWNLDNNQTAAPGESRLDAAKQAITDLFNSGNVNAVYLITFSSNAQSLNNGQWYDNLDDALAAVNGLSANGGTDYDAALEEAVSELPLIGSGANPPPPGGSTNTVVFLTDGEPTQDNGSGSVGIDSGEEAAWIDFVRSNGWDDAYAIGFGGITDSEIDELEPIAVSDDEVEPDAEDVYDDGNSDPNANAEDDPNVIIIAQGESLTVGLSQTVDPVAADGNVLDNDTGADDPLSLVSIQWTDKDGNVQSYTFTDLQDSKTISLGTQADGDVATLTINADGSYNFAANADADIDALTTFNVTYVATDAEYDYDSDTGDLSNEAVLELKVAPLVDVTAVTAVDTQITEGDQTTVNVTLASAPLVPQQVGVILPAGLTVVSVTGATYNEALGVFEDVDSDSFSVVVQAVDDSVVEGGFDPLELNIGGVTETIEVVDNDLSVTQTATANNETLDGALGTVDTFEWTLASAPDDSGAPIVNVTTLDPFTVDDDAGGSAQSAGATESRTFTIEGEGALSFQVNWQDLSNPGPDDEVGFLLELRDGNGDVVWSQGGATDSPDNGSTTVVIDDLAAGDYTLTGFVQDYSTLGGFINSQASFSNITVTDTLPGTPGPLDHSDTITNFNPIEDALDFDDLVSSGDNVSITEESGSTVITITSVTSEGTSQSITLDGVTNQELADAITNGQSLSEMLKGGGYDADGL